MRNKIPCAPVAALALTLTALSGAEAPGNKTTYIGGTLRELRPKSSLRVDLTGNESMGLFAGKASVLVPYRDINTIEYGQRVSRRYMEAVLISPLFLVAKKRAHFVTIGYEDREGKQQAVVLAVPAGAIRTLLVSLEARTGRRVAYQDDEARKAGKG